MTSHFDHGHSSPCLSVDIDRALYHCFSCGEGGTLRSLYFERTGHGILKDLGLKTDDVYYEPYEEKETNFDDPPETNFEFVGKTAPAESCRQGQLFLKKRGFDRRVAQQFRMKYVANGITRSRDDPENKEFHINFKDRVIVPVYERGHLISLEGRDPFGEETWRKRIRELGFDPSKMTYKKVLYPKLSSTNSIYGLASLDFTKRVYVTEGLMDMIALRTCDELKNSTCLFGATVTRRQLYLLGKFPEVVVVPDRDEAGLKMLRKILEDAKLKSVLALFPPAGCKDANEILLGKNQNVRSIEDAVAHGWLDKIVPASEALLS